MPNIKTPAFGPDPIIADLTLGMNSTIDKMSHAHSIVESDMEDELK